MCDRPCGWEQGLLAQSWQPPRLELISKQMRMDVSRPGSPHWSLLTCFTFFFSFFFLSLHVSIRVLLDILLFSSLQTYWSACPPPQFPSSSLPFFSFYNVLPQLSNFLGYSQNCHFIFSTSSTSTPPAILLFIYLFFWGVLLIRSALAVRALFPSRSVHTFYFYSSLSSSCSLRANYFFSPHFSHLP